MHFSLATHICEGKVVATKVTLSGEKASCGMETSKSDCPINGTHIGSDCCKDRIAYFTVDNEYSPTSTLIKDITRNILQVFLIPVSLSSNFHNHSNSLLANVSPWKADIVSALSLEDICVFRI